MQAIIDVRFDDTAKIPSDLLLAAEFHNLAVRDLSVTFSYVLDGKEHVQTAPASALSIGSAGALRGISCRQPYPQGAKNRRIAFCQTANGSDSSLFVEGYIAVGEQLHHCNVTEGVLSSINSKKAYRFGKVQLVEFTVRAKAQA
jgi:LSD1 subclass zinc finger protein